MTSSLRYRGFISYSHKDRTAAVRLHRALESYRLPKGAFVGSVEDSLRLERRLGRFFLDQAEVRTAQQVNAELFRFLDASQCLIVVASPNSAASERVADEILYFQQTYPDRPIFTVLAAGDPGGEGEHSPFPRPLIVDPADGGAAPLAGNIAAARGLLSRGREVTRLVAAICNFEFDDLWRRWSRQRALELGVLAAGGLMALGILVASLTMLREAKAERLLRIAEQAYEAEIRIPAALATLPADGALLPVSRRLQDGARRILARELYNSHPDAQFGEPRFNSEDSLKIAVSADGRTIYGRLRPPRDTFGRQRPASTLLAWDAETLILRDTRLDDGLDPEQVFRGVSVLQGAEDWQLSERFLGLRDRDLAEAVAALDPQHFIFDEKTGVIGFASQQGFVFSSLKARGTRLIKSPPAAGVLRVLSPTVYGPGRMRYYHTGADHLEEWDMASGRRLSDTKADPLCSSPQIVLSSPPFVMRQRDGRICLIDVRTGRQVVVENATGQSAQLRSGPAESVYLSFLNPAQTAGEPDRSEHLKISLRDGKVLCRGRGSVVAASSLSDQIVTEHQIGPARNLTTTEFRLGTSCSPDQRRTVLRTTADRRDSFVFHPVNGALYLIDGGLRRISSSADLRTWTEDARILTVTSSADGRVVAGLRADGRLVAFGAADRKSIDFGPTQGRVVGLFRGQVANELLIVTEREIVRWSPLNGRQRKQGHGLRKGAIRATHNPYSGGLLLLGREGAFALFDSKSELQGRRVSKALAAILSMPNVELVSAALTRTGKDMVIQFRTPQGAFFDSRLAVIPLDGSLRARSVKLYSGDALMSPVLNNADEVLVQEAGGIMFYVTPELTLDRSLDGGSFSDPPPAIETKAGVNARAFGFEESSPGFRTVGVLEDVGDKLQRTFGGGARPTALALDPAGQFILVGGQDGVIRLWRLAGGAMDRRQYCSARIAAVRTNWIAGREPFSQPLFGAAMLAGGRLKGFEICPCRESGPLSLRPGGWPATSSLKSLIDPSRWRLGDAKECLP